MFKGIFSKRRNWFLVSLVIILVAGGIFMFSMLGKSQEERRNREYEVSLVNALKNSYEGIEEVHISNPSYAEIPSEAWGADVSIHFLDGISLNHALAFNKETWEIRIGIYNEEDEKFEEALASKKGQTTSHVKVRYSDGTEEEL